MKEETCDETHKSSIFSKNTHSKGGKCQKNCSSFTSSLLSSKMRSKKYRTRNGNVVLKSGKSYEQSQSSKGKSQRTFNINKTKVKFSRVCRMKTITPNFKIFKFIQRIRVTTKMHTVSSETQRKEKQINMAMKRKILMTILHN